MRLLSCLFENAQFCVGVKAAMPKEQAKKVEDSQYLPEAKEQQFQTIVVKRRVCVLAVEGVREAGLAQGTQAVRGDAEGLSPEWE